MKSEYIMLHGYYQNNWLDDFRKVHCSVSWKTISFLSEILLTYPLFLTLAKIIITKKKNRVLRAFSSNALKKL